MVFSSIEFVCAFLPVVFLLYCLIPGIYFKNILLIIASLLFYAYGEPAYVLLMAGSAFVNYIFAMVIANSKKKKMYLFLNVTINIGLLIYFKYIAFFIGTWNYISGQHLNIPYIKLPVRISFLHFYFFIIYINNIR